MGGRHAGTFGAAGCFSFYPSKNLGAYGDGGAIVLSEETLANKLRGLRSYGSTRRYFHDYCGVNSRLDELQAAWLRVKLSKLKELNRRRSAIANIYGSELRGVGDLQLPEAGPEGSHVWHLYVIQTSFRDQLQAYLSAQGCETFVHYPRPVYRNAAFAEFSPARKTISDHLTGKILSLPIGPHLSIANARLVCEYVRGFFSNSPRRDVKT
jgi:dTDP-4-amino-4,6-dideoxygalactose transaminase